jgi:acyl carrier protein
MSLVENKIKTILANVLKLDASQIGDDASMENLDEWDSLRQLSLILTIEDELGVSIPDSEVQYLTSLRSLTEWLSSDA